MAELDSMCSTLLGSVSRGRVLKKLQCPALSSYFIALQDVGRKIFRVADLIADGRKLVFFIKDHQMALAMYRNHSNKALLALVLPGLFHWYHSATLWM